MLNELEWPSLEACRGWSSLLLFHKVHCVAVSIKGQILCWCFKAQLQMSLVSI